MDHYFLDVDGKINGDEYIFIDKDKFGRLAKGN